MSFLVQGSIGKSAQEKEFVIFLLWSVLLFFPTAQSKLLLKMKGIREKQSCEITSMEEK